MATALTSTPSAASSNDDISGSVFRSQPHNIEAEKALLGAIFIDNRVKGVNETPPRRGSASS